MESATTVAATYDYSKLIKAAEREASRGCGHSYELFETRVQAAYSSILANAPDSERSATAAALEESGFEPDFIPYQAQEGECSLTGIDTNCCPCGNHP